MIEEDYEPFSFKVPMEYYKAVSFLHDTGVVEDEQFEGNFVMISGSIKENDRKRYKSILEKLETALT
jgi:DNA/RNA endonuclease G (NUC1)